MTGTRYKPKKTYFQKRKKLEKIIKSRRLKIRKSKEQIKKENIMIKKLANQFKNMERKENRYKKRYI